MKSRTNTTNKSFTKPSKEDILLQFEARSLSTKSKIKTFSKNKQKLKTDTLKTKHNEHFTKSYAKLNQQERTLENELQTASLQILENDDDQFITFEIKKLNDRNNVRKSLHKIIKSGDVEKMNEMWGSIAKESFTDLGVVLDRFDGFDEIGGLGSDGIVPSEIVEICSRLFQDEYAFPYYLSFVELFMVYNSKIDDLRSKLEVVHEEIENNKAVHAFATVV